MQTVDRVARDRAAALLGRFVSGAITNDEFADSYPSSQDGGVKAIRDWVWHFYDDLHEHHLEGRFALTPEARASFERCALFLKSDLAFEWPPYPLGPVASLLALFAWLPPLSLIARRFGRRYEAAGDFDVWPFMRRSDYDRASQPPGAAPGAQTESSAVRPNRGR